MKIVLNRRHGGFELSPKALAFLVDAGVLSESALTDDNARARALDNIPREHPELVRCVETLGDDANTEFSKLRVVEVGYDQWHIRDFDGMESVQPGPDLT